MQICKLGKIYIFKLSNSLITFKWFSVSDAGNYLKMKCFISWKFCYFCSNIPTNYFLDLEKDER